MDHNKLKPFQMPYYVRFRYVPGTKMAEYYPHDNYYAGFNTIQEARTHLLEALERTDVKYEPKIYTKKELNEEDRP